MAENEKHETHHATPSSSMANNMIKPALRFLVQCQNGDGGWGEALDTYRFSSVASCNSDDFDKLLSAKSTASQTAWALMGLVPYLPSNDPVIERGVQWLITHQTVASLTSATLLTEGISLVKEGSESVKKLMARVPSAPPSPPSSDAGESGTVVAPLTWSSEYYTGTGEWPCLMQFFERD